MDEITTDSDNKAHLELKSTRELKSLLLFWDMYSKYGPL